MPFFLRKEIGSVGDHEPEVSRAGLIDPGKVHFVQNSVA
jgi:hypothetical protein